MRTSSRCICAIVLIYFVFFLTVCCQHSEEDLQKMNFKMPNLTDEEQNSAHLPDHLKCDACKIMVYQFQTAFENVHKKFPSMENLPESEIIDILENKCDEDFDDYGVKQIDGISRFSGPGMAETEDYPGVVHMGGKWPSRLKTICSYYLGETSELTIYEAYQKNALHQILCLSDGMLGACRPLHMQTSNPDSYFDDEL